MPPWHCTRTMRRSLVTLGAARTNAASTTTLSVAGVVASGAMSGAASFPDEPAAESVRAFLGGRPGRRGAGVGATTAPSADAPSTGFLLQKALLSVGCTLGFGARFSGAGAGGVDI
jgi:hypothetical protein